MSWLKVHNSVAKFTKFTIEREVEKVHNSVTKFTKFTIDQSSQSSQSSQLNKVRKVHNVHIWRDVLRTWCQEHKNLKDKKETKWKWVF